jgi:hypothetical protein
MYIFTNVLLQSIEQGRVITKNDADLDVAMKACSCLNVIRNKNSLVEVARELESFYKNFWHYGSINLFFLQNNGMIFENIKTIKQIFVLK